MLAVVLFAPAARAADPENCLSCHRYRGLARVTDDGQEVRSYHLDPNYYDRSLGPHTRLRCTDCHERSEVAVIPHKPATPVNCAKACHLTDPRNMEVRFSHEKIATMLESSVHKAEVLDKCNGLLDQPLRPGQSRCLLCHDEPLFRRDRRSWVDQAAPVDRCNVCHDEQLAVDVPYTFWHVSARSRPARGHMDVTRGCAVCHSNSKILDAFKLPDATASYMVSFHGKAMQLASSTTAGCLECHVGPMQNVHVCLSHKDADAPTHPSHLADTCRSPACHPTATANVSSAAVHLDLASSKGIEYFVGALFILLILGTFGPSAVLQVLELVQIIVGRRDPKQEEREHLADAILATHEGRAALCRFTPHQRVQHWILMICFTALVVTGFPIKFADRDWSHWLVSLMGGLSHARLIHRWAGAVLLVGLVYHLVYVGLFMIRQKRTTGKGWIRIVLDLPMVATPKDFIQIGQLFGFLLFARRTRPALDRFSLKEKFEYFGVFWGTVLLGLTGLLMWANAWTTEHLPGRALTIAMIVHTFEALLALLHVGVLHMITVIFSPTVFPVSPAMFTGNTSSEELVDAHAGMIEEVARQMKLAPTGGTGHE